MNYIFRKVYLTLAKDNHPRMSPFSSVFDHNFTFLIKRNHSYKVVMILTKKGKCCRHVEEFPSVTKVFFGKQVCWKLISLSSSMKIMIPAEELRKDF